MWATKKANTNTRHGSEKETIQCLRWPCRVYTHLSFDCTWLNRARRSKRIGAAIVRRRNDWLLLSPSVRLPLTLAFHCGALRCYTAVAAALVCECVAPRECVLVECVSACSNVPSSTIRCVRARLCLCVHWSVSPQYSGARRLQLCAHATSAYIVRPFAGTPSRCRVQE